MSINIVPKREKNNKFLLLIEVENNLSTDITSWYIECTLTSLTTLDKIKNYNLIKVSDNVYNLVPLDKDKYIKVNKRVRIKVDGSGSIPSFKFINETPLPPTPTPPPTPSEPTYIYNLDLTNLTSNVVDGFKYQYSYDKQEGFSDSNPNPDYFNYSPSGYVFCIYKDDQPFKKGDDTFPRTEWRGLAQIRDNVAYTLSFDQYIDEYPDGYQFCWVQVFAGSGPNIMLRYRNGSYQLLCTQGKNPNLKLKGTPADDLNVWTNWKIEFLLATSNGYVKVYRNNELLGTIEGNTSGQDDSYLKTGVYSQQMNPIGTMKIIKKNLQLWY